MSCGRRDSFLSCKEEAYDNTNHDRHFADTHPLLICLALVDVRVECFVSLFLSQVFLFLLIAIEYFLSF